MIDRMTKWRILTLRQPWATLYVHRVKKIETRSWGTRYRGPVIVHSSARMNQDELELCFDPPFAKSLVALGYKKPRDLPMGTLLGAVNLVDCLPMVESRNILPIVGGSSLFVIDNDPRLTALERDFGAYATGRYAWIGSPEKVVFPEPIPARGSLGLWEPSNDVAAQLAGAVMSPELVNTLGPPA